MGQRIARVNELVKREISSVLHTDYRDRAVTITICRVSISPDLRNGRVWYSVIGDAAAQHEAEQLFARIGREIQRKVFKAVTLKYTPQLEYTFDPSFLEGERVQQMLDELEQEQENEE